MSKTEQVKPPDSVDVDENVWKAWLEKGRQRDRILSKRLKAVTYSLVILVSLFVTWASLSR